MLLSPFPSVPFSVHDHNISNSGILWQHERFYCLTPIAGHEKGNDTEVQYHCILHLMLWSWVFRALSAFGVCNFTVCVCKTSAFFTLLIPFRAPFFTPGSKKEAKTHSYPEQETADSNQSGVQSEVRIKDKVTVDLKEKKLTAFYLTYRETRDESRDSGQRRSEEPQKAFVKVKAGSV